jgi:hypothetical protein
MMMTMISSTRSLDDFQWTSRRHNPEDRILPTILMTLKLLYQNISQTVFNITICFKVTVLLETYSHSAKQYIPAKLIPSLQWQYYDDDHHHHYYTAIRCSPSGSRFYSGFQIVTAEIKKGTIFWEVTCC